MSRIERLRQYANPRSPDNWCGEASDRAYLDRWSERAGQNSGLNPRARGGEMRLSDTGIEVHDTSAAPKRTDDARAKAKADLNFIGAPFLASVRR